MLKSHDYLMNQRGQHLVQLTVTFLPQKKKNIKPHSTTPVSVHLQIEIQPGYYGRILPSSGLARHHFIDIGRRAIDSDFRG